MSYYIRMLSATTDTPTPADLAGAATRAGHPPAGILGADPEDGGWREVDLEYGGDRCPLRLERTLAPAPGELPEVARFTAAIGKPGRSKAKKQVLESLAGARQIIVFHVPDHVLEEDDWGLVHSLLYFLQPRLNGLIQADGEGFYNSEGSLVVPLE